MIYIIATFKFGYEEIMNMEHTQRITWVKQADEFNTEQRKAEKEALSSAGRK